MKNIKVIIFDLGGTLKVSRVLQLFPETKDVLKKLSKKYRLVIGANQPVYAYQFLKDFGIENYFEKVYLSVEIGYEKPDPMFFQYILNDLKLKPDNVIMVGDNYENDIAPARLLGIKTVWLNYLEEEDESDFTIQNLKEVLEIL